MPLFFFISGVFYRPQKYKGYLDYIGHETRALLVPYLLFSVFYEILHFIYVGEWSLRYFLISICSSNHNRIDVAGAMWFLLCLFSAKAVYHALTCFIKNKNLLTTVVVILSLSASFLRTFSVILPFALDSALSCLWLIHVGYLLYLNREKPFVRSIFAMKWWMFLTIVIVFFITALGNDFVNVRRNRYGMLPLYIISCFSGILLTMNVSGFIEKKCSAFGRVLRVSLSYWGKESIVFLVLNELMIFIVAEGMGYFSIMTDNYWMHGIIALLTMALLSVIASVVPRTPFRYLFGRK